MHEICLSQPLSVALQLCLVDLLASWGVHPSAVTSHSSGEIAAAYAVGALTFKQALGVVYFRGELAQLHHERAAVVGGMLAAGLGAEAASEYLKETAGGTVVVACHNSPSSVTLSGDMAAVDEVAARLTKDGVFARKLNVPLAYHSHHMAAMSQDYTDRLNEILQTPATWTGALFASPVTGDIVTSPKVLTAGHYVRNLVSPVLFSQAFERMCFSELLSDGSKRPAGQEVNIDLIVEIGAHGTLSGPIHQILQDRKIPYVSCLKRFTDAIETVQDAACRLVAQGYPVSLTSVNGHENGTYIPGLPTYAWNHNTSHWTESRLYREYRHKRFQPHELLGSPIAGSNRQTPMWRNFLRPTDIGWLADHKLGPDTVLPGAGYVAMAIEAVRLVTDASEDTVEGYRLREISISNALAVPETAAGVEVQFMLHPSSDKELDRKGWYDFEVWSVSNVDDSWMQHCKGSVAAEIKSKTKEAVTKTSLTAPRIATFFAAGAQVREVDTEKIFTGLRSMNIFHGPVFQNLIHSRAALTQSVTSLAISPAVTDENPPYVLHPTTLDSLIQAAYVSIPATTKANAMVVPRSIRHLYVPRDLKRQEGETVTAFVNLIHADRRGAKVTAVAVNGEGDDSSASRLELEGLYCQALPLDDSTASGDQASELCSQTRWEIDIAHGVPDSFKASLEISLDEAGVDFEKKLDRVSFNFILEAVKQLEEDNESRPTHLQKFAEWLHSVVTLGKAGKLGPGCVLWSRTNAGLKQRLTDDVAAENPAGKLVVNVGQQLAGIVRGQVDVDALLQANGALHEYHETLPRLSRALSHLREFVAQYAVTQPGVSVLEVNGGIGAVTAQVLAGFASRADKGASETLLGRYDFAGLSADLFEAAKRNLAPWEALVKFKPLGIHSDATLQGFVEHSYDVVVATDIALATKDASQALGRLRRLIRPGGKLLLLETTRARLDTQLIFGGLPSWWRGEEAGTSIKSVEDWQVTLQATGFRGVDFSINDCKDEQFQATSVILATAAAEPGVAPLYPTEISIVYGSNARPTGLWLDELQTAIAADLGATVTVTSLENTQSRADVVYLFTPEIVAPFLDGIDHAAFERLKLLIAQGQGLLWLSRSSTVTSQLPVYAQSTGLLRTVRQEDGTKRYVSLDFEVTTEDPWSSDTIPHILQVLRRSFNGRDDPVNVEWEYAVQNNTLHVPRVYPSPTQDRASSETPADPAPALQPLWQANRPLVWETVKTVGTLSDLYFTDDPQAAEKELSHGVVEIETEAMGLNFRDVMVALGQIDESRYMHDAAGVVTRLGPGTEASGLRVGDRVTGVLNGRFATHPRALWTSLIKIPDDMPWEEAASLSIIFLTSYICLFDLARLQPGERVLVHAGSGGVGQSAIMLAQHAGAEVFVTCSSETKRDLIKNQYGLDSDHILSSRDTSFAAAILERTGGAGVDVVINSLSGSLLKATWDCMARFGRFLEIGKVDIEAARRLDLTPLTR